MTELSFEDVARQNGSLSEAVLHQMHADGRLSAQDRNGVKYIDDSIVPTIIALHEEAKKADAKSQEAASFKIERDAFDKILSRPSGGGLLWGSFAVTAIGTIVAAIGVTLAYCQITNAINTLQTNNDYRMQLDYADAFKAIIEAPPEKIKYYSKLYDEKFRSIRDLHENGGISRLSWNSLVARECPKLAMENFSFGDVKLVAAKEACDAFQASGEDSNANTRANGFRDYVYCLLCPNTGPGTRK